MTIHVTENHILCGERGNPFSCPVVRAFRECIARDEISVQVGVRNAYLLTPDGRTIIHLPLPLEVTEFIHSFDARRAVVPISFEVDWQPESPTL